MIAQAMIPVKPIMEKTVKSMNTTSVKAVSIELSNMMKYQGVFVEE